MSEGAMFRIVGILFNPAEVALLILLSHRENAMTLFEAMIGVEQRDHTAVQSWLESLQAKGILRPYPDYAGIDEWMFQDNDTAQAVFTAVEHMDIEEA